jgi:hypothetical protein
VLENPLSRALFALFAQACHGTSYSGVVVATRAA